MFKIYSLTSKNLIEGTNIIQEEGLEDTRIALGRTIFFNAYCNKFKIHVSEEKDTVIDGIVYLLLPTDETERDNIIENGIVIKGRNFLPYTSTPSLQKKETYYGKCEFIFVAEDEYYFCDWFEDIISLGKFKEKFTDNKNEISINKMVTSRTALGFSTSEPMDFCPKIIIVKNPKYDHKTTVDVISTDENYKLILKNNQIEYKTKEAELENIMCDGMGIMSLECAEKIATNMQLDYIPYFAIIRSYLGLAVKGMCISMDFVSYATEYNNGSYDVIDAWGHRQDIRECDLLLTESQVKWLDNFESHDEWLESISNYKDVWGLIAPLYVTKVSKNPKEVHTHTLSNYQLMSNLDISYQDYSELAGNTYDFYKDVLSGNLDAIKAFLKNFTKDDDEDYKVEESEQIIQPSTKSEYLLNKDKTFYNLKSVRDTLKNLVKMKIFNLMSGRFYIRGNYTILAQCPISLLNNVLNIDERDYELAEDEFYHAMEIDKEYVIQRCPCNCYSEILNIKTTTNKVYNKYLSHLGKEILVVNGKDSTLKFLSGADVDGDGILKTDEPNIINSTIKSDSHFVNQFEGETNNLVYSRANKFKALIESSGNLIGEIAIFGAKLSNICFTKDDYIKQNNLFYFSLLLQQICIDCPKTLFKPTDEMLKLFNEYRSDYKKPYFMKYRDIVKGSLINNDSYISNKDVRSIMDRYCKSVYDKLYSPYYSKDGEHNKEIGNNSSIIYTRMSTPDISDEEKSRYDEVVGKIEALIEEKKALKEIRKAIYDNSTSQITPRLAEVDDRIKKFLDCARYLEDAIEMCEVASVEDKENLKENQKGLRLLKKEKRELNIEMKPYKDKLKKQKEIDKAYITEKALGIESEYGAALIAYVCISKKYIESVCLGWFFTSITKFITTCDAYVLDECGANTDEYEYYLFEKKYMRKEVKLDDSTNIVAKNNVSKLKKSNENKVLQKVHMGVDGKYSSGKTDLLCLIGKELTVGENPNGYNTAGLFLDDSTYVGYLRSNIHLDGTNLLEYEKVKVINVTMTKTGLKNIYLDVLI